MLSSSRNLKRMVDGQSTMKDDCRVRPADWLSTDPRSALPRMTVLALSIEVTVRVMIVCVLCLRHLLGGLWSGVWHSMSRFLMQCACMQRSGKDALGRRLGQTAAAKLRERTASARRKAPLPTPGSMPPPGSTPARRGRPACVTPARPQLSSAGKKLAQSLHGK